MLLVAALSGVAVLAGGQNGGQDGGLKSRYIKQEFEIPMRDGVTLFTVVYAPLDTSKPVPILMTALALRQRAVWSGHLSAARSGRRRAYEKDGYIFVYQDVRGRFCRAASSSRCGRTSPTAPGPTESTRAPTPTTRSRGCSKSDLRHNGRVGMWGMSLPRVLRRGRAAVDAHPALKAVSPQAPVADWFIGDDFVPQRRVHAGRQRSASTPASSRVPARAVGEGRHAALQLRHAGRLRLLSRARRPEGGQCEAVPAG